jgi:hypothetical protein
MRGFSQGFTGGSRTLGKAACSHTYANANAGRDGRRPRRLPIRQRRGPPRPQLAARHGRGAEDLRIRQCRAAPSLPTRTIGSHAHFKSRAVLVRRQTPETRGRRGRAVATEGTTRPPTPSALLTAQARCRGYDGSSPAPEYFGAELRAPCIYESGVPGAGRHADGHIVGGEMHGRAGLSRFRPRRVAGTQSGAPTGLRRPVRVPAPDQQQVDEDNRDHDVHADGLARLAGGRGAGRNR